MKFDYTPLIHAAIAVATQLIVWVVFANPWLGALLACTWWIAREHTQAEYRWISRFAQGKRSNMPQWGGFDLRVWDMASVLDFAVPIVLCSITYFVIA